jgi:hypothetical protein
MHTYLHNIGHRINNTDLWQAIITHPDIIKSCLYINDNHSSILSSEKYLHAYVHDEMFLFNIEKILIGFGKIRNIHCDYIDMGDNRNYNDQDSNDIDLQWLTNLNNWSSL